MRELKNKTVLIVGLGRSGLAAVRWCAENGSRVIAVDTRSEKELEHKLKELEGLNVQCCFGAKLSDTSFIKGVDAVIASPGIPLDVPLIGAAYARGIRVIGELNLGVQMINRPIIAVSGTNGKSTVVSLIAHILRFDGLNVCVAGNIGRPLLSCLDEANNADYVVLEVSSFQLESEPLISSHVAVLLNIAPDHLDRHHSLERYAAIKMRLADTVKNGGWFVYNYDDETIRSKVSNYNLRALPFSTEIELCPGAYLRHDYIVVNAPGGESLEFDMCEYRLRGLHNLENAMSAALVTAVLGVDNNSIQSGLVNFRGLPHRLQFVMSIKGVDYYNDSKATNVAAVCRSVSGFNRPVILIAGGRAKGEQFVKLREVVRDKVKFVVVLGEAKTDIKNILDDLVDVVEAEDMEAAVLEASKRAKPGDVVVLSPACASFDMFRDYQHRGDVFLSAVRKLAGYQNE